MKKFSWVVTGFNSSIIFLSYESSYDKHFSRLRWYDFWVKTFDEKKIKLIQIYQKRIKKKK